MSKIFGMAFGSVYPLYVKKLERKGRTRDELDHVIEWLTGYTPAQVETINTDGITFEQFFDSAKLNENVGMITGVICGMRVETIEDPLMQKIRYLDKLVDEVANGRPMEKVLRS